jgi:hypothetical protein
MPVTSPPLGLRQRRQHTELQKQLFLTGHPPAALHTHPEIIASWQRSAYQHQLSEQQDCARSGDTYDAQQCWEVSPLRQAAAASLAQVTHLVNDGKCFASIANLQGQLLWTCASAPLRGMAERSNVVLGAHWDEASVGTTGISLALTLKRPVTVLANEHYLPLLQGLVCYSAPIIHPQSGELHGILSLGMSCEQHTPMGELTITALAQNIVQQLPQYTPPQAELEIHALGQPHVLFRGKPLHLSPRMIEILCILALNPEGLTLEACHAVLYGDEQVATATLKAELSHLRTLLDGRISARTYRLVGTVWVDFIALWAAIRQHQTAEAQRLYKGELLPNSQSLEIKEWRTCISTVMASNQCPAY